MISFKGFSFPQDIPLLLRIFFCCSLYALLVRTRPIKEIFDGMERRIEAKSGSVASADSAIGELDKVRRGAGFLLRRFMGFPSPCLPRSLVLYHWCLKASLPARIMIGISKDSGTLKGHAWLTVQGRLFMEDPEQISGYKVMISRGIHEEVGL